MDIHENPPKALITVGTVILSSVTTKYLDDVNIPETAVSVSGGTQRTEIIISCKRPLTA